MRKIMTYPNIITKRKVLLLCSGLLISSLSVPANATLVPGFADNDFMSGAQSIETGGNQYQPPQATNTGNGAYGAWQQRKPALVEIGYENKDGSWNAQNSGVPSRDAYLQCLSCQITGEKAYLHKTWGYLSNGSDSTVSKYLNKQGHDGVVYNESALLECGTFFGPTGCRDYLDGNYTPLVQQALAGNHHWAADAAKASQYDSSEFTGGNTKADNSELAKDGQLSNDAAAASMMTYCAKEIQDLMSQAGMQEIDKQTMLAGSKEFGYTLMDGNGILDDAGDGRTPGKGMSGLAQVGYSVKSCMDNMMSQITGLSTMFTKPSLSQLLNQVVNMACSAAQSQLSQAMSPLYQKVGSLNNMAQVGGGGFFPSTSLGSFNISQGGGGTTGCNSSQCSVSFSSLLGSNDASWYKTMDGGIDRTFNYMQRASDSIDTSSGGVLGNIVN